MNLVEELNAIAKELNAAGLKSHASKVNDIIAVAKKEKWMQKAVNPKEKGELRKKMKAKPGEALSLTELEKEKKRLQEKGKGDKKLSPADREKLQQIIFAINAKKSKKKKKADLGDESLEKLAAEGRAEALAKIFS